MNVKDVNVATRNMITKEQVFKEREPRKNKTTTYLEKEIKKRKNNGRNHTIIMEGTNYK